MVDLKSGALEITAMSSLEVTANRYDYHECGMFIWYNPRRTHLHKTCSAACNIWDADAGMVNIFFEEFEMKKVSTGTRTVLFQIRL